MLGRSKKSTAKKKAPIVRHDIGFERILEEIDGENQNGQGSSNSSGCSGNAPKMPRVSNISERSVGKSDPSIQAIDLSQLSLNSSSESKLMPKNGLCMRACFRMMGEFYRYFFNRGVKGKKVSRNYCGHMQEFVDKQFSREFAELPNEKLKVDFFSALTQLT